MEPSDLSSFPAAEMRRQMSNGDGFTDLPSGRMPARNLQGGDYPQQLPSMNLQTHSEPWQAQGGSQSSQKQRDSAPHRFSTPWEQPLGRSGDLGEPPLQAGHPSHSLLPQVPGLDLGAGIPRGMDGLFPGSRYPLQSLPQPPGLETGQDEMQPVDPVLAALGRRTPVGNPPSQGPGPQHGSMNPPQARMDQAFLEALGQDPGMLPDAHLQP